MAAGTCNPHGKLSKCQTYFWELGRIQCSACIGHHWPIRIVRSSISSGQGLEGGGGDVEKKRWHVETRDSGGVADLPMNLLHPPTPKHLAAAEGAKKIDAKKKKMCSG